MGLDDEVVAELDPASKADVDEDHESVSFDA